MGARKPGDTWAVAERQRGTEKASRVLLWDCLPVLLDWVISLSLPLGPREPDPLACDN